MTLPGWLLQHTATVEPFQGVGASGPVYGSATTVRCFVEDAQAVRRDDQGREIVSSARLYCGINETITSESRVTINGRSSIVIAVNRREAGGLPVPEHLEVMLK